MTDPSDYPHSGDIAAGIPVYNGPALTHPDRTEEEWRSVMAEWNRCFATGPGIIAIRSGYTDLGLVDNVTAVLNEIIQAETLGKVGKGDHFAASGANSRIWNAHEKLCVKAPELFALYNTNELVRRVSEAWLGPNYQITTQANVVHPGGSLRT